MNLWLPEGLPRDQQIDAEKACQSALSAWMRRTDTSRLTVEDREDALQILRIDAWRAGQRFDPSLGFPFRNFLFSSLYHRTTDWLRQDEGRTNWKWADHSYERERPLPSLSLDAPAGNADGDPRLLGELVAVREGSDTADRHQALGWIDDQRDRYRARDIQTLGRYFAERDKAVAA